MGARETLIRRQNQGLEKRGVTKRNGPDLPLPKKVTQRQPPCNALEPIDWSHSKNKELHATSNLFRTVMCLNIFRPDVTCVHRACRC